MNTMFKIKIIFPERGPFRAPSSRKRKVDAARMDGPAKVVFIKVMIPEEMRY